MRWYITVGDRHLSKAISISRKSGVVRRLQGTRDVPGNPSPRTDGGSGICEMEVGISILLIRSTNFSGENRPAL